MASRAAGRPTTASYSREVASLVKRSPLTLSVRRPSPATMAVRHFGDGTSGFPWRIRGNQPAWRARVQLLSRGPTATRVGNLAGQLWGSSASAVNSGTYAPGRTMSHSTHWGGSALLVIALRCRP